MTGLVAPPEWFTPSPDPQDRLFADVVETTDLAGADDYDAVIVGETVDGDGAPGDPWTTDLREALAALRPHHLASGAVAVPADLGTVTLSPGDAGIDGVQESLRDFTARIHRSSALPLFVGTSGALTVPNARPLLDGGTLGLLSFDVGLGCQRVSGSLTGRTAVRQLLDAGLDSLAVVGARDFETAPAEQEFVRERGGAVVAPRAVVGDPLETVAGAVDALGDVDAVYLRVNPAVVGIRDPGGLSPRELYRMVGHAATDDRVAGVEVIAERAGRPGDGRAARIGARAIAHVLAGREVRR